MLAATNHLFTDTGQLGSSAAMATGVTSGQAFTQEIDAELLGRLDARDTALDRASISRDEQAMDAAKSLVSIGLVQPMLALAREDPFRGELFHGGQGEEIFGAQLDAIMAEQVTKQMGLSLVDSVYKKIVHNKAHPEGVTVDTRG